MTVPGRGNGLVASFYVALADLHPQLADQMLDELRDAGVAAYAAPVPGTTGPGLEMRLPNQPTDRLYVDRDAGNHAQELLRRKLPELHMAMRDEVDGPDLAPTTPPIGSPEDEAWAAIVAAWDKPSADPVRHRVDDDKDSNDTPRNEAATASPTATPPSATVPPRPVPAEEHYVPPAPPPLPKADTVTRLAWIGVVCGPLFFLVTALLRIEVTAFAAFLGVSAFVGGFVTLVARMRDRPAADDDPDNGAVV